MGTYKNSTKEIIDRLNSFKKKYYINLLIKGGLMSVAIVVSIFIIINFAEYFGRFNNIIRGGLLISFVVGTLVILYTYILRPLFYLFHINEPLTDAKAATQIGRFFPEVSDKLLNILQLSSLSDVDTSLIDASIAQKSKSLKLVNFSEAIRFDDNKKYLKYTLPPLLLLIFVSAISPKFFSSSTERLVKFRDDFTEEAPFKFSIVNDKLSAMKNEDYQLNVQVDGNALPEEAFIFYNNRKFKMNKVSPNIYSFAFNKVSENIDFNLTAAGFDSKQYRLKVVAPPNLLAFDVALIYPAYLSKQNEKFSNVGNLVVPEGTRVAWQFTTSNTDSILLNFDDSKQPFLAKSSSESSFNISRSFRNSTLYDISLRNKDISNQSDISYYVNVIADKYPVIDFTQIKDSTLYSYVLLGGNISDDYGLNQFKLFYKREGEEKFKSIDVPFIKTQSSQRFYYQFDINSLKLDRGQKLSYFLQLWDNDGVNGSKSVKTSVYTFEVPKALDYSKEIDKEVNKVEDKMQALLNQSKELKKNIDKLDKKLKINEKLGFQEKKELENILKQKQELQEELKKLVEEFNQLQNKQERFNKFSPETQQKMDQLQELMKDLMKDENSELYKQLQELLNKNEEEKAANKLDEIKRNERNMDKNIDRTLKLFKNLQLKQKVEDLVKDLKDLADKQDEAANKSEEAAKDKKANEENKADNQKNAAQEKKVADELKKEQEKINEEFKDKEKQLEEVEKMSEELDKPFDSPISEKKEAEQSQQDAKKELQENKPEKASKAQKKSSRSMRKMAEAMSSQMQSAEMKQLDLDIDALRDILENVVKLSFDQERVLKDIKGLNTADPRFVELSQEQLKLVDDAKVVEDSLYSLAQKVMQIESYVTKEVTDMNNYMNGSLQDLKDRKLPNATAKQQFSMTSINNLALLLSDTFKSMQQMMMAMSGSGSKGGKKGNMPMPGMGEQQKGINERLQKLGQGNPTQGEGGRKLSEELAGIAQDQAKLRKELERMRDKLNGTKEGQQVGQQLGELQKLMDESETDIVNKKINPTLIRRQKLIETRLLEAEIAIKEQELDPTRKSNVGLIENRNSPKELDKLIDKKINQNELIRFTPPSYTPFYKNQTDRYFNNIK